MPNLLDPDADQPEINSITSPTAATGTPQFSTAEYAHIPGTERCKLCNSLISGEYYRVNTLMACGDCAKKVQEGLPTDTHVAFIRAVIFGAVAAVIGMIIYATVEIITGFTIGYLALGVGWLVATAMMKGSNKIGGIRYQVAAVLLTYLAISTAAVPAAIALSMKESTDKSVVTQSSPAQSSDSSTSSNEQSATEKDTAKNDKPMGLGQIILQLFIFGIASPFLALASPGHGIIGLVILFVGLSIAFRMTAARALALDGPYSANA